MILEGPEGSTIDPKWTRETNLGQLGRSSHNLGQHCPKVGLCWGQLDGSLSQTGAKLEPTWSQLGLTWCKIWPMCYLGPSWRHLGSSLAMFGKFEADLGSIWRHVQQLLGQFASTLGRVATQRFRWDSSLCLSHISMTSH